MPSFKDRKGRREAGSRGGGRSTDVPVRLDGPRGTRLLRPRRADSNPVLPLLFLIQRDETGHP